VTQIRERVVSYPTVEPLADLSLSPIVAYALGIYLLNLFLAFLQPKFDPSNDALDNDMEDGAIGSLPTKQDEEFRPFIRRLPEFKFWHSATRAVAISFVCSWFEVFNVPVFWPVLVMYWFMLFILTSRLPLPLPRQTFDERKCWQDTDRYHHSEEANSAHDQVPLCAFHHRQGAVH
jgi:hypothetical protein